MGHTIHIDKKFNKKCNCRICGKDMLEYEQYCYSAGYICSKECYDTLFGICEQCGCKNMSVKINLEYGLMGEHKEALCDTCYNKKHGLGYMVIKGK